MYRNKREQKFNSQEKSLWIGGNINYLVGNATKQAINMIWKIILFL